MIILQIYVDGHNVGEYRTKFARNALNIMDCLTDVFGAQFEVFESEEEKILVDEDSEV